jgi:hypothetical protein
MSHHFSIFPELNCLLAPEKSSWNNHPLVFRCIQGLCKVGLFAATLAAAAPAPPVKPYSVYHNGVDLVFSPEVSGSHRLASFGPWNFGERLAEDKPLDKRLNLYVLVPGGQYHSPTHPEYDHTRLVNKYTADGKAREWDIYWCFVLDPSVSTDLRSERELLITAQQRFRPADLFDIVDVPANTALAEKLGIATYADLKRFRRKDGTLPRILILPAHFAVRGKAQRPESAPSGD